METSPAAAGNFSETSFSGNRDLDGGADLYIYDDEGNSATLCGTKYDEMFAGPQATVLEEDEC